jgi:putative FmdB family regulatory protein
MPIYEYACPTCGQFEVTQRITDEPLKKCPTCKSKVRKLISNTSFQLKGSGWYATDYAGKKGAAKEAGGAAEDGGAKSGEGAEKPKESSGESAAKDSGSKSKDSSTSAKKDTSSRAA